MLDSAHVFPIDSDVLIAPHHGADNASSTAFILAVSPEYVIFSAGHRYEHARAATATRNLNNGVLPGNMFRTGLAMMNVTPANGIESGLMSASTDNTTEWVTMMFVL